MSNKKECNIVIVEDTSSDNGYDWTAGVIRIGEIDASSVSDMVTKILKHLDKEKCCLKSLTIIGHGCPGNISVGNGQEGTDRNKQINDNEDVWGPELDKLKARFCKDGKIYLWGCNVGADQAGADKLYKIAKRLGIPVGAPTGTARPAWTEGEDVEADPNKKPTPKPAPSSKKKKKAKLGGSTIPSVIYVDNGKYQLIQIKDIFSVSILPKTERKKEKCNFIKLSEKVISEFRNSLDVYESFSGSSAGFAIEAYVYIDIKGESGERIGLVPRSYLCGGLRYLVLGGDWNNMYSFTPELTKALRKILYDNDKKY